MKYCTLDVRKPNDIRKQLGVKNVLLAIYEESDIFMNNLPANGILIDSCK